MPEADGPGVQFRGQSDPADLWVHAQVAGQPESEAGEERDKQSARREGRARVAPPCFQGCQDFFDGFLSWVSKLHVTLSLFHILVSYRYESMLMLYVIPSIVLS